MSNKSAWRLNAVPRTFRFDVSNVHLFTRLDTQKLPLAVQIVSMEITIHQGSLNLFQADSEDKVVL